MLFSRYTLIAVVAYKYFGQDVTSPALSSATPVVGKIAWTVSIPTIIVAGVIASQMLNNETLSIFWNKAQLQSDARKPSEKSVAVAELGSVEIDVNQQPIPHEVEPRPKVSRSREWTVRILTSKFTPDEALSTCRSANLKVIPQCHTIVRQIRHSLLPS